MAYRAVDAAKTGDSKPLAGRALGWVWNTRLVRAFMRYVLGAAGLRSGGVTWSALLALTAVGTILVNVARTFLGENPAFLDDTLIGINEVVPGLVATSSTPGLIDPESLVVDSWWNPVTFVSGVVAAWTATNVITGLRRSIRAMFGLDAVPPPILTAKVRDFFGFLGLGVCVLASFALSTAFGPWAEPILSWLGVHSEAAAGLVTAGAVVVAGLIDALVFAMLFRFVAGVRAARRDLFVGAVLGAVGAAVLRLAGTALVGVVQDPLLASFAALATLAILVSLCVRWTLLVAAWTANPPAPPFIIAADSVHRAERPNFVTLAAPRTLDWPHHPVTGEVLPVAPEETAEAESPTAAGTAQTAPMQPSPEGPRSRG